MATNTLLIKLQSDGIPEEELLAYRYGLANHHSTREGKVDVLVTFFVVENDRSIS